MPKYVDLFFQAKNLKTQLEKMMKTQNSLKTKLEEKDSEIKSATANQLDLERQLEGIQKKVEEDKEFIQQAKEQVCVHLCCTTFTFPEIVHF